MSKDPTSARPAPQAQTAIPPQAQTAPAARLAKGFRDIEAAELRGLNEMIAKIRDVYERYGFQALETPAIEYTDALGKFLPDQDRPNAGVFSFQDEDEQWMSLRYDLTAPLARYVAQNFQTLPKPFRRYAFGNVYRNEKPGPGRFRQFMQFDADTVGAESIAADAEMCMLAADTLEALGVKRGDYVIKVNSRKVLDGVMEAAGIGGNENVARRLTVLRAIDKFDRLGMDGVRELLGKGRRDESGDFTIGAGLTGEQAKLVLAYVLSAKVVSTETKTARPSAETIGNYVKWGKDENDPDPAEYWYPIDNALTISALSGLVEKSERAVKGLEELRRITELTRSAGYGSGQILIDPSVVRGLEYYTGPVFEAELTFEVKGDDGKPVRFGSVGGGGRYDDLVARFTGEKVPATGFSIGVSRLQAALSLIGEKKSEALGPVVVLVMDKGEVARYQKITQDLRNAGVRAEMYLGSSGMKAQMKYADKRNAPCAIIQGSDERAKGEVTIKDLIEGAKAAAAIKDNKEWKAARPAQFSVSESSLIDEVKKLIARHQD
ncbi:histidyl-tRNA ligase [Hyphomicrobium denitrificans 1NES1]|uniref:Histidine--tRNA ligase n=1 Tax=Hyphomicrobium denitrificans 1NES1 TaxID=670307 RepID=N0B5Y4_9HYPH|nr:histidine--tRNA ligase [Hyphomicrobium denitrificans]AGK58964.1 histidyl-tRNA ligase [Hyphomicrobium denitrificans 1NES1]